MAKIINFYDYVYKTVAPIVAEKPKTKKPKKQKRKPYTEGVPF